MRVLFTPQAKADYDIWQKSGKKSILDKIERLLIELADHPYTGTGKPEALRYELAGKWSRRINSEHRIIYSVCDDILVVHVLAMRYHYK